MHSNLLLYYINIYLKYYIKEKIGLAPLDKNSQVKNLDGNGGELWYIGTFSIPHPEKDVKTVNFNHI